MRAPLAHRVAAALPMDGMRLRLHLALCSMCRTYMDQMRKTRALVARRPLAPPDQAAEDALIARITAGSARE